MTVHILHGANAGEFPVSGKTLREIKTALRHVFNVSDSASAFIHGTRHSDNYVVVEGDRVEFVSEVGEKGGQHFWAEVEMVEVFGADAVERMKAEGMVFSNHPVMPAEKVASWVVDQAHFCVVREHSSA